MKWLHEVELEDDRIKLIPLRTAHKEALLQAASDGELWKLWYTSVPDENTIDSFIEKAIGEYNDNKSLTFVVVNKFTNSIIGTTRFMNLVPEHRRLEIGHTWYAQSYHKTYVNTCCKLLLLQYAFEQLGCIAVEFRTNWYNFASRNAITRLGAKQDGILRNHQIMKDGVYRDTVVFSITNQEWAACKKNLKYKQENKKS